MEDFPFIGEPAGLVLARLGLPQDNLIKVLFVELLQHGLEFGIVYCVSYQLLGGSAGERLEK